MMRKVVVGFVTGAAVVGLLGIGAAPASAAGFTAAPGSPFASGGAGPALAAVGDLNGDGKRDVVVVNQFTSNVSVLLGNGSGGLSPAPGSPTASGGLSPVSAAIGDFNGDSKPDVAVANFFGSTISVLLGNGSGGLSLAPGSPFAEGGTLLVSLAVADFNGDGKQDLVAVNDTPGNNVAVLLGNGSGGLSQAPGSPFATGGIAPIAVAVGDFNGDGKADAAVAEQSGNNVAVLLGNGGGGLSPATGSPFATGGDNPISLAIADFNGDGKPDVAVANRLSSDVSILLGNGSGGLSLSPASPVATGGSLPKSLAVADFDGDGSPDVAVANQTSNDVSVLLGNGSGGLGPAPGSPYGTGGSGPSSVAVGDFNGDGRPDLAVAHQTSANVAVLLNDLLPTTTPGCKVTGGGRITTAAGDTATFGGNANAKSSLKGSLEYSDQGPAQPITVRSRSVLVLSCSSDGTKASIFGKATIDGAGSFDYRIDVQDLGEPGRNDTYRIRLSNGYDSGERKLDGGNIQVHKIKDKGKHK